MTTYRAFKPYRTVQAYGYMDGDPIEEPLSPSGYLLSWEAIDDEKQAREKHRPSMYVVIGEWERDDGVRYPELAVSEAYMESVGYVRDGPMLGGSGIPSRRSWRPRTPA